MKKKSIIEDKYREARYLALVQVEEMARDILKKHPNLGEFIMGMGTWTFTFANGDTVYDEMKYMKKLSDFISEWDEYLKLTGEPMRFTANGRKVTDW